MSASGTVFLGSAAVVRVGWQGLAATAPADLGVMLLGGACNAVAFYALGLGLAKLPVVYVNVVNGSQAAIAAVAGVVLFAEPLSTELAVGVVLTVLGIGLLDSRRKPDRRR